MYLQEEHYYKLHINHGKSEYDVYYKTPMNFSLNKVAKNAVIDDDLIANDFIYVEKVEQISKEEYHKYMQEDV